jgi:hypothetical protein
MRLRRILQLAIYDAQVTVLMGADTEQSKNIKIVGTSNRGWAPTHRLCVMKAVRGSRSLQSMSKLVP